MAGEFEPNDSRNVTGTASTPDGRWTAQGQQPPLANGQSPQRQSEQEPTRADGGGGISGGGLSNEGEGEDMENRNAGSGMNNNQDQGARGQQQQFDPGQPQMGGGQQSGSLAEQIREHMSVVDAEGTQVGMVDSVINDQIKLTRSGSSDGEHHYLPIDRVAGIEGDTVRLHDAGESVFGSNGS